MNIERHSYTISHIVNGYKDNEESGVMAVPISIVLFTNQFEIVGALPRGGSINGRFTFKRILIKKRKVDYD